MGSFCLKYSICGEIKGQGILRTASLPCKAWHCKRCGPKRLKTLKRAITSQGEAHGLDKFLTLTIDQKDCTAAESYERIKATWHKFLIYVRREYGEGFKFIWTMEPTRNGYAHLHILINKYMRQDWISRAWSAVGGGVIVFVKKVRARTGIGYYLTKYILKEFLQKRFERGQRRYGCARVIKLTNPKTGGWIVLQAPLSVVMASEDQDAIFNFVCDENGEIQSYDQFLVEEVQT